MLSDLQITEWQTFVESHPDSTAFHHRNWIELLAEQYGLRLRMPAIRKDGIIVAAAPFLETRALWGARKWISLPYTDCMSMLSRCETSAQRLRTRLIDEANGKQTALVLRTDQPLGPHDNASPWVRHTLDTSRPLEDIVKGFDRKARGNLRRAEKRKLSFESSTDADAMNVFYRLQVMTRQRIGMPVQPKRFFRRLHERMIAQGLGFVGIVRKDDRPIAAAVFLTYNRTMVYKYLACDSEALEHRPNEFLSYHGIRLAVEQGYSIFDFGISKREQEGLRRFKRKLGATESDVDDDYLVGKVQPLPEDSRLLRLASVVIRHSPPAMCQALGEVFYRYSQ